MTHDGLSGLTGLADMVLHGAQARLSRIQQRETDLRAKIAKIGQDRAEIATRLQGPDDAALAAGADGRWLQWIAMRQTHLNTELLQVLELKRLQIIVVRDAFGRASALAALEADAHVARRRQVERRMARDG
ncbi:hypothetical protein SAMN04488003_10278 [Loktanella fryxellensis]|uniref:Flagellar FliJ protein n=1 Tax=Loktanella fryxellensis TaxID=245187 RepID=A0A1H7ZPF9_9RHOB|nr:hypothetical protein [Loktanella fryxellensis]SEM60502.1 hypothetical protein SAMN04488003_10278 [Loktanella fryxellensis]